MQRVFVSIAYSFQQSQWLIAVLRTDRKIGRTALQCPEIGPGYACTLPVQGPHGKSSYGGKVGAQMCREQEREEDMGRPGCVYVWQDHEAELGELVISFRPRNTTRVRTRRPTSAKTVSLLLSLAFRSPISPEPMTESEAKCIATAALEPPATIPHSARKEPLRHKAVIRIPEPKSRPVNVYTNLSSWGDRTSRTMAISFRMSARKRYVFASGNKEVPSQYAKMIAVYVISPDSTRKRGAPTREPAHHVLGDGYEDGIRGRGRLIANSKSL